MVAKWLDTSESGGAVAESTENAQKPDWGILKHLGMIVLFGGLLFVVLVPTDFKSGPTPFGRNISRAGGVASLCQIHAMNHGGKFPSSLATLDPPLEKSMPRWQYHDPDSGRPYDWLYFPGQTTEDAAKRVILASPTASTNKDKDKRERIVACGDGHVEVWSESEFQEYQRNLAAQRKAVMLAE